MVLSLSETLITPLAIALRLPTAYNKDKGAHYFSNFKIRKLGALSDGRRGVSSFSTEHSVYPL